MGGVRGRWSSVVLSLNREAETGVPTRDGGTASLITCLHISGRAESMKFFSFLLFLPFT